MKRAPVYTEAIFVRLRYLRLPNVVGIVLVLFTLPIHSSHSEEANQNYLNKQDEQTIPSIFEQKPIHGTFEKQNKQKLELFKPTPAPVQKEVKKQNAQMPRLLQECFQEYIEKEWAYDRDISKTTQAPFEECVRYFNKHAQTLDPFSNPFWQCELYLDKQNAQNQKISVLRLNSFQDCFQEYAMKKQDEEDARDLPPKEWYEWKNNWKAKRKALRTEKRYEKLSNAQLNKVIEETEIKERVMRARENISNDNLNFDKNDEQKPELFNPNAQPPDFRYNLEKADEEKREEKRELQKYFDKQDEQKRETQKYYDNREDQRRYDQQREDQRRYEQQREQQQEEQRRYDQQREQQREDQRRYEQQREQQREDQRRYDQQRENR